MLKINQVAEILGVHRATVYRMIYDGRIKAISLGRGLRVNEEEIEKIKRNGVDKENYSNV